MVVHIHKILFKMTLVLALVAVPLLRVSAQAAFTIKITAPTEGAQISGPFALEGATTVPPEKQLSVRVYATATNEQLIAQPVPVVGEVLQQGTFRIVLGYDVSAATPALIQVLYTSPTDGSVVAKDEVRVVLRKYDVASAPNPGDSAALAATQLALADYEGRVQVVTPIPSTVEERTFSSACLDLARPGETCNQEQVAGKVVKLSFGGVLNTYHVGNNQARFNEAESGPITVQPGAKVPKILADAAAATGVKLYVPVRPAGPFEGLYFRRVDWENGVVTITWGAENNPLEIRIMERAGKAAPAPTKPTGETINIGGLDVPVQVDNGRRYVEWLIQTTVVSVSVPQNISNADLAALANSFSLLGSTQPGQTNPLNYNQFSRLTLALPEPVRSAEMARQAFMSLVKPARQGGIVAVQARRFSNGCVDLARQGEACTAVVTPGYVIGIADAELYRYHVAESIIRLNRDNSELKNKTGVDYATLEVVRGAVPFAVAAPTGVVNTALLGIQVTKADNAPVALLIYRDNQTGGVFSLRETGQGTPPAGNEPTITIKGAQVPVTSEGGGRSATFIFQAVDRATLVTLWASPEVRIEDMARIANALAVP
jgi:Immunoglobulin-like domain of bacterial spore germination